MTTTALRTPTLAGLHALLKPLGFRKVANVFSLASQNVVHLIEVQGSRDSTKDVARFTVNVGVFALDLVYADIRDVTKPSIPGAHWRARLGTLSPEGRDLWWQASTDKQAVAVAEEVVSRVENYALPALFALPNLDALVLIWKQGKARGLTDGQRKDYLSRLGHAEVQGAPNVG